MNFYELIKNRESIRNYDPSKSVNMVTLNRILEAGCLAPSAANRQPFQFLIISSKKMLDKVRPCYSRAWFQDAPHILIVVGDIRQSWVRDVDGYNSLETDVAIALDHMILAAEHEGLATCWIAAYDPDILRSALSLKDHERIFAIAPLGYPKEGFVKKKRKQRKLLKKITKFL